MIESAALLFRVRGVRATSFSDVIEHSRAPRGSIYHHFPGGKTELAEEATRWAGNYILARITAGLVEHGPVGVVDALEREWTDILRDSGFAAGCTVAAATLEAGGDATVRDAAAVAFSRWQALLCEAFREHGLPARRASSVATLFVASIEGALLLARAQRSTAPLEQVAAELKAAVGDALAPAAA